MPKLQRQGGVVLSPSHQRQFLSRSGLYQTLAYGCRTSPLGGANFDERRKKLSCQTVLSSHIGLFCPLALSSEVPSSKVAFFRGLQNSQRLFQRFQLVLAGKMRLHSIPRRQTVAFQFSY